MDTTPPSPFRRVLPNPHPAVGDRRTATRDRRTERAGLIRGKVLDVGCGTGEHTILLTGLGYDVLGIDFAPEAVEQARRNAAAKGVEARFEVADAMNLRRRSALRHHRGQRAVPHLRRRRPPEIRRSLHGAVRPGGIVHVLALSDHGPRLRAAGQRRDHPGRVRRRMGARGARRRPPIAVWSRRCTPTPSGCRSAAASTSPRGWPGPAASEVTSPRRSRGGRRRADAAPGCAGTAAPRLPCRRGRRRGWRPPARFRRRYPRAGRVRLGRPSSSRSTVRSTFAATRAWKVT